MIRAARLIASISLLLGAIPAHWQDEAATTSLARGPVFVSFDGLHQLVAEANRQRMLTQELGFTLEIDAEGKPTECELNREFRRRALEIALCRPLLRHMKFEPARDENGEPTTGTYSSVINFQMWMTQEGYLEPSVR